MTALAALAEPLPCAATPLSEILGVEIAECDVRRLDDIAALRRARRDHQAVVFRDQSLTPAELPSIAARMRESGAPRA